MGKKSLKSYKSLNTGIYMLTMCKKDCNVCTCSVKISCVKIVFILLRELGLMAICTKLNIGTKNKTDKECQQWKVYCE